MNQNKIIKLIISILICQAAGLVGSLFTAPVIGAWYATLQKPGFNPPDFVFAPVWTILFLLMGLSLYLVWVQEVRIAKTALVVFGLQLLLNILWSYLFFGLKSPVYGMIEILFLWLAILTTIIAFYRVSRLASFLLLPYIFWVSFAAILNFFIWRLN